MFFAFSFSLLAITLFAGVPERPVPTVAKLSFQGIGHGRQVTDGTVGLGLLNISDAGDDRRDRRRL